MSTMQNPYIELIYKKIMSENANHTTRTIELEVLGIMILVTKSLNETGELGKLSDDKINELETKLQLIRHLLTSRTDIKSQYTHDLIKGLYNQDFLKFIQLQKNTIISKQGSNLDKFFSVNLTGGKRGRKTKSKKFKKSKSKKTKSKVRKH